MMYLIYETGDWAIYAAFAALFVLALIRNLIMRIKHWLKYPIQSANPPKNIRSSGDVVTIGKIKYIYIGYKKINMTYEFQPEDSLKYVYFKPDDFYDAVDSISDKYGIKWERKR